MYSDIERKQDMLDLAVLVLAKFLYFLLPFTLKLKKVKDTKKSRENNFHK